MANLLDRVVFTPVSSGTGDFVVSAAVAGYQTPAAAGAVNATVYYYAAESADKSQWEVGSGGYTTGTTTLARTNVYFNSLGTTAKVSFTVAPKVMITLLNETPLGGAPGGSSGQLEYNAAGSFGGLTGSVVDNTNQTLTLASIANPAAPTLTLTGGTAMTTGNQALLVTQTWNNAPTTFNGVAFSITNTASQTNSRVFSTGTTGANCLFAQRADGVITVISQMEFRVSTSQGEFSGGIKLSGNNSAASAIIMGSDQTVCWTNSAHNWNATQDTFFGRGGAATFQHGAADAAAPVAQTIQVQSVVAGTSNTAGANWTFAGSKGTGTGVGGDIIFQIAPAGTTGTAQNAAVETFRVKNAGGVLVNAPTGFSGNILELQVAGSSKFGVNQNGGFTTAPSDVAGNWFFNSGPTNWTGSLSYSPNGFNCRLGPSSTLHNGLSWGTTYATATFITSPATAAVQQGDADAAAPVAQTIQVQSVVAGTSNTAGTDWTLQGSRGTGTGIGGSIIFKTAPAATTGTSQNAAVAALTLDSTQLGNFAGYIHWAGQSRVTSDFSVTSSAVLVNVTGLTANVAAGRTYYFEVYLACTCAAAGGVKAAIAGTATATNIIYDGYCLDSNTTKGQANSTALAGTVASSTTTATAGLVIQIQGTITVANAGTLTVQFAQNTSNGTASIVKRGSWFEVDDIQ